MNKHRNILALLLILTLLLCLLPATALAGPGLLDRAGEEESDAAAEELPAELEEAEGEDLIEAAEPEETESAEELVEAESAESAPVPELRTVCVEEGAIFYAAADELVYANAAIVYSNGGTVYNNGGTVYANGGTVYNNAGTVYANGGTVYNNGGKVYSNGAVVYTFGGDVETSLLAGYYRVSLPEDLDAVAVLEGLVDDPDQPGGLLMTEDAAVTVSPREGFTLVRVKAENASVTDKHDGSFMLSDPTGPVALSLQVRLNAPVFSLAPGSYAEAQELTLSAAEGAAIYYTLDGSAPGEENALLYEGPITLEEGATVTAVAAAPFAETSPKSVGAYAIVSISAPEFAEQPEGYDAPQAQGFTVESLGSVAAVIESVAMTDGDTDAFRLGSIVGGRVSAGTSNTKSWTVCPVARLEAGDYAVTVTFTLEGGSTAEREVSFRVAPAEDTAEDAAAEDLAAADAAEDLVPEE